MEQKTKTPRGIRNNNPLNIVHSTNNWRGMAKEQTDRRFVTFTSMPYGIRAAFKTLQTYCTRWHCYTLTQYIRRWCPPLKADGSDTKAYISFVAKRTGLNPDVVLPSPRHNTKLWCDIADAMIRMENGQAVQRDLIERGWHLAFDEI